MPVLESHASLAALWSFSGVASSIAIRTTPILSGPDISGAAATVISTGIGGAEPFRAASASAAGDSSVPGQILGRYRLIERLGRGCQGDVWRATLVEPADDEGAETAGGPDEVALKLLPPSLARDPRRLAQFRREAERRARLAVPQVLPTFEVGEAGGVSFMVMPLVEGCSLGEVVAGRRAYGPGTGGPVDAGHPLIRSPEAEYLPGVVRVVAMVARTLEHVHNFQVVHRDIKPANILVDRRHEAGVFLCDFGLSRDLDVATPEQLRDGSGTPLYMPPERLLRLEADEVLCDIYSLGATLYEVVTLVPPVQLPESLPWPAWTSYLATTLPERPSTVCPGIPEALEAIILRAMAHDPSRRYPSSAELADDLERFLARPREGVERGDRPASSGTATAPWPGVAGHARPPTLDFPWETPAIVATALSWHSSRRDCLCHPDRDAWEIPIAAE